MNANQLVYDEASGIQARKLIGDVRFKHEGTLMYCDSAYLFSETNTLYAYGNVRANRGDTLTMEGDSMKYYGNTQLAELRGNVFLKDATRELRTQYLDFDMKSNQAYYLGGGVITDSRDSSTLQSQIGYYNTTSKTYFFRDSVEMTTTDYHIRSDSMEYRSLSELTLFYGPTTITRDSSSIYCERGWFDRDDSLSQFTCNARIQEGSRIIEGDSIFYNQGKGEGYVYRDVAIQDTTNKIIVYGDYGYYNEIDSVTLVTGNALFVQAFQFDSLFLHADSLWASPDSTGENNLIRAYHKVKFFKPDMQGKCDSLTLSEGDSLIRMYRDPVIWSDVNQMTGDFITIKSYDGIIENLTIHQNAFIISEESPNQYNQVKGRILIAYFEDNVLDRIRVNGNGQTIYYGKQDDGSIIGMNRLDCSNMLIYLDSNEISSIRFYVSPKATLYPLENLTADLKFFRYFSWRMRERPLRQEDIFTWEPVTEGMGLGMKEEEEEEERSAEQP